MQSSQAVRNFPIGRTLQRCLLVALASSFFVGFYFVLSEPSTRGTSMPRCDRQRTVPLLMFTGVRLTRLP